MSEAKFKPGDIIRKGEGSEKTVVACVPDGGMLIKNSFYVHMQEEFELVFRPARREETEALRRVAKAARYWDACRMSDKILVEKSERAADDLSEALTAWKETTTDETL